MWMGILGNFVGDALSGGGLKGILGGGGGGGLGSLLGMIGL